MCKFSRNVCSFAMCAQGAETDIFEKPAIFPHIRTLHTLGQPHGVHTSTSCARVHMRMCMCIDRLGSMNMRPGHVSMHCEYECIHAHMHACMHAYIHTYIHTHIHTHKRKCTQPRHTRTLHQWTGRIYVCIYTYTYICMRHMYGTHMHVYGTHELCISEQDAYVYIYTYLIYIYL